MSALRDIICTAADLFQHFIKLEAKALAVKMEEHARSVECSLKRMCFWFGLLTVGLIALLGGIGLIIAGAFILLTSAMGAGAAAVIVGIIVTLLAFVLTVTLKSSMR
jgi:uncharacterized membrane protein YhaH (DUF805 family)